MHHCLLVPDVVREIIVHCPPSTLAALAATCRSLSDPALDALWREVPSLSNLIRCLPDSSWSTDHKGRTFIIDQPVALEGWSRFEFYARRVRIVNYKTHFRSSDQFYTTFLAEQYRLATPFPNLSALYVNEYRGPRLTRMEVFFGPKLEFLELISTAHVDENMTRATLSASLSYLPHLSPSLFTLHLDIEDFLSMDQLDRLLAQLPKLRDLSLFGKSVPPGVVFTDGIMNTLSSLQHLDILQTSYGFCHPASREGRHPFPSLHTLAAAEYAPNNVHSCADIIREFELTALTDFYLSLYEETSSPAGAPQAVSPVALSEALKSLTQTIRDVVSPHTLKEIDLHIGSAQLNIATIRPLFAMSNLRSFLLTCCHNFDESAYMEMARAWPKLRAFRVRCSPPSPLSTPLAPLRTLLHFVRHCTDLEKLNVDLDATNIGPLDSDIRPGKGFSNHRLTEITVARSPIDATGKFAVAAFLSDIFPNLRTIHWTRMTEDGAKTWDEVEEMLPTLSFARSWGKLA